MEAKKKKRAEHYYCGLSMFPEKRLDPIGNYWPVSMEDDDRSFIVLTETKLIKEEVCGRKSRAQPTH